MKTGERIKARRIELNMTVEALAKAIGKNKATIYRYENGDIESLPTSVLKPLAKALYTTPAYLMGWVKGSNESEEQEDINISIVDNSDRTAQDTVKEAIYSESISKYLDCDVHDFNDDQIDRLVNNVLKFLKFEVRELSEEE